MAHYKISYFKKNTLFFLKMPLDTGGGRIFLVFNEIITKNHFYQRAIKIIDKDKTINFKKVNI